MRNAGVPEYLTLLLIVKDEAELVTELLERHRGLYDAAVVVDTGSRDDTAVRAREVGARVVSYPWCDDFAAARNAGLDSIHEGWLLILDADERIARVDFPRLRQAMAVPEPCCYLFPQRNYTTSSRHPEWRPTEGGYPAEEAGQTGHVTAHNARLFPSHPGLRYQGRVHETVEPAALRLGWEVRVLDVPIHHYGHVRSADVLSRRQELYGRLVRAKHRDDPEDSRTCLEMARRLLEEGKREQAASLLAEMVATGQADSPRSGNAVTRGRLLLARLRIAQGRQEAADGQLRLALTEKPDWLCCWTEMLEHLARSARWTEVTRYLKQAQRLFGSEPLLVRQECRLLIATGRLYEAATLSRQLADRCPAWSEASRLANRCESLARRFAETSPQVARSTSAAKVTASE